MNYLLFAILKLIGHLPFRIIYSLSDLLYFISYYLIRYRREVVKLNLQNAFPLKAGKEIKLIEKKFYKHLCDMIVEILKVQSMTTNDFRERLVFENDAFIFDSFKKNQSSIALVGHIGNHEWLGIAAGIHFGVSVDTIYKQLNNKLMDYFIKNLRSRFGNYQIEMKTTLRELIKRKNINRMIAVAGDQAPPKGESYYQTKFLNQNTSFYTGFYKIAQITGYMVFFGYMKRIKRGFYKVVCEKIAEAPFPDNPDQLIQIYVDKLDQVIQQNPELWLWSHRRWKR